MKKNAAKIMEELMESGLYPEKSNMENKEDLIKKGIHKQLKNSEEKRHEFGSQGIVAKFVPKKITDVDYQGLKEYLYDIGLLIPLMKIDDRLLKKDLFNKEIFNEFKTGEDFYVRPNFNKLGKELNKPSLFDVSKWELEEMIDEFRRASTKTKEIKETYKNHMMMMAKCPVLEKDNKIKHKYGSVSRISSGCTYDLEGIHDEIGAELLIKYGKVNTNKLQEFIYKGTLSQKDVDQFRTIVDVRLDFMVMSLDTERRMIEQYQRERTKASQARLRA
ncbi:hypothetical protein [Halobacillus litoralis]|uniref:Uncharacterized protein n=1 Tax=Halobacillus litoralis TaxID=45668 RepID=A0A410MJF2_9BACI|nr:hypothetical protein [Halobacillus litoralis]QAS54833.1 hypothetical protein HLI_21510 [Halobacillus litoralis]